ncbi:AAA family ATPase [Xanthomonas arboricola]|uniref:AAA family ATPase n=1 Tax=Xanthomonas arboricola TaxID=56448 RepID=UPI000C85E0B6|nr:AAA family ATPase [Xanthomonas arboricola]PPU26846.1 hypothetical protein XarCFBP6762_10930 [Xanthomonas arboricola]SOT93205.1 hypothetical protein CFBP6762_00078 [Xanthomonas arboricola pv. fragariae]
MYKIKSVNVVGLWHRHDVKCSFDRDINVVIGRNGTGKTTFMNVLHGILAADIDIILENQFESATIILEDEKGRKKTIKAIKHEDASKPFPFVEYKVSTKRYNIPLVPLDERRNFYTIRRKASEYASEVRAQLSSYISLASLSVYRMRSEIETEPRERAAFKRIQSPVDQRLNELVQRLTLYQLEIAQKAQEISIGLQRQVLTTLLYEKDQNAAEIRLSFNAEEEKKGLQQAYHQLGVTGPGINKRISEHVTAIEASFKEITLNRKVTDFSPIEAKRRTDKVIRLSLDASEKTRELYSQIDLFIKIISGFIVDKKFSISAGDIVVQSAGEPLSLDKLSSGEKQLLILLIEAVLQRRHAYVFMADEPELSLHIAWQRKIIPAVKEINPNAQVIVATHSPEIAGRYRNSLIDMEDMTYGKS